MGGNSKQKKTHKISWENATKPKEAGGLGLRSMRQANAAFQTKLDWRLMKEKESLWSRVVRAKYCDRRCDINLFSSKHKASNIWQGISENAKLIRQRARAEVGNGKKTFFWFHSWACDKPLSILVTNPIPSNIKDATVEELWDEKSGWKWDLFDELLPEETIRKIASISVNTNESEDDCLVWDPSGNDTCSVKSLISFIREEENGIDGPI